ncbi:hypothetical protein BH20ACI4_BH20ACI4_29810 [soil metagenome]
MRKIHILIAILFSLLLTFATANVNAQGKERFTGTVIYYGSGQSTRTVTTQFTLDITGYTSDAQAKNYLNILKDKGQEKVLDAIDDTELGRFSVGANVGVPVNVVRERDSDGNRRIFVVFKRWTQFAELRYGYRSLDYPFGVIELFIDPKTNKGEGTYIAAARVRWDSDGDNGAPQVEIENFATYPARLLGVKSDRKQP